MPDKMSTIGTLAPEQRVALGTSGLRTFWQIADRWNLSVTDQRALLGDISRSTHHTWRQRPPETPESYTTDRLTRLSYLLGIYGLLEQLYGGEAGSAGSAYADAWVSSPNHASTFRGQSPLAVMREQGIPGLHLVRRLLEATAGGGLEPVDELAWDGTVRRTAASAGGGSGR